MADSNYIVPSCFKIKIAIDTQILSYLIDNTYPNVTYLVEKLSESPFVDLVCARFTTFEFIGIRKKEHYLRFALENAKNKGIPLNISSFINYRTTFSAPEYEYKDAYEKIIKTIDEELKKINDDFGITFDESLLHKSFWEPHKEFFLSTRISKEDSLVLLSSVFPDEHQTEDYLIFLTNDSQFNKGYNKSERVMIDGAGGEPKNVIDEIFTKYGFEKPFVYHLGSLSLFGDTKINPKLETITTDEIDEFLTKFIFEHIKKKNNNRLLGKTFCAGDKFKKSDVTFFKIDDNVELNNNIYITAINQNLDFIYNSGVITSFNHKKCVLSKFPFICKDADKNISFEWNNQEEGDEIDKIKERLCSTDNYLFVHPDS